MLGLDFWIVAWVMMALAFLTAFLAIVIGTKSLDADEDPD